MAWIAYMEEAFTVRRLGKARHERDWWNKKLNRLIRLKLEKREWY